MFLQSGLGDFISKFFTNRIFHFCLILCLDLDPLRKSFVYTLMPSDLYLLMLIFQNELLQMQSCAKVSCESNIVLYDKELLVSIGAAIDNAIIMNFFVLIMQEAMCTLSTG